MGSFNIQYGSNDMYFEKVSQSQYIERTNVKSMTYDDIILPRRSTKYSAGYDFYIPYSVDLKPTESVVIDTYIKCKIASSCFLAIFPRSGLGFKYNVCLANTVGIIDSDYYNNVSNEGHIKVKLVNNGNEDLHIECGDKFCQGIFLPYFTVYNDEPLLTDDRSGGFGSTGN